MGTPFTDVYDQFLMFIKDYRLTDLYNASATNFETYLQGWLIPAIADFGVCNQSLAYSSKSFTETLTAKNIVILAKLMVKQWLQKEINDVLQMNQHIMDKDFKVYSESQNMAEKRKKYSDLVEEISQIFMDYSLNNSTLWGDWLNGRFYVP